MDEPTNLILERLDRVLKRVEAIRSELLADFAQVKERVNALEKTVASFKYDLAQHGEGVAHQWRQHDETGHAIEALRGDLRDLAERVTRLETPEKT